MNIILKSLVATSVANVLLLSVANAATYEVVDKGEVRSLKYTYAQQENNLGSSVLSGGQPYNFPVLFQHFDKDNYDGVISLADRSHETVHELEDIEDETLLRQGEPTANDLAWVIRYLQSNSNSLFFQKVGGSIAITSQGGTAEEFVIYDVPFANTSTLTRSTTNYVNGITENGWIFGNASAPYLPLDYTQNDGTDVTFWHRNFSTLAYVSTDNGQTINSILPPETSHYQGESAILDINNNIAVGYASTGLNQTAVNAIVGTPEDLDDNGVNKLGCEGINSLNIQPAEMCVQVFASNLYVTSAYQWKLDENANVVEEKSLGLLVTPHVDDSRIYQSVAQAVNGNGVVVGYSHGWVDETETEPSRNESRNQYAVVFKGDETISFTDDHEKYFDSRAYDINDQGTAVGHVNTFINGSLRTKFYYIDTSLPADEMTMIMPDDFFNSSSSTARAINANGFIVGEGEVETHNSSSAPRRKNAFLYDLNEDKFTNLNDLVQCNSPYTIIEARDINDNNEIFATAIVKAPRRDSKGEIVLDDNGNQVEEDVVRAITLKPINGEIDDCSAVENVIKRQGASVSLSLSLSLIAILMSFGFRRKV